MILVSIGCSSAPPHYRVSIEYELLRDTETFFFGPLTLQGALPDQVIAFQNILRKPWARAAFRSLLLDARPPGRLYALCGLYLVGKDDEFEDEMAAHGQSEEMLETQTFDMSFDGTVEDVAQEISKGMARRIAEMEGSKWEVWPSARLSALGLGLAELGVVERDIPRILGKRPLDARVMRILRELLNSAEEVEKIAALRALERFGPWARDVAPLVCVCLNSRSAEVRSAAADALVVMSPLIKPCLGTIKDKFSQEVPEVSLKALLDAACQVGPAARDVLRIAAENQDANIRARAEEVLGWFNGEGYPGQEL